MVARAKSASKVKPIGAYFSSPKSHIKFIPTGSKMLDLALGGGWARGRIANIVGDKSSGKTLLAIEASANFDLIAPKGRIRYREAEYAFDEQYAAALGFPVSKVDFGDPILTVEDLFRDMEAVIKGAKGPELYIVDSLDALSDEAEQDRDIGKGSYGTGKAKKMSELFRKLVGKLSDKDVTVLIISQIRDDLNSMYKKYSRSGGHALDFYASHVLYLQHLKTLSRTIGGHKRAVGIQIKAKVDKNKIALAFREAEFPILFGFGLHDIASCLQWLKTVEGGLKEVGVRSTEVNEVARDFIRNPDRGFQKEVWKCVESHWFRIEKSFLPETRKYDLY